MSVSRSASHWLTNWFARSLTHSLKDYKVKTQLPAPMKVNNISSLSAVKSRETKLWRRTFSHCSSQESTLWPSNHEAGALLTEFKSAVWPKVEQEKQKICNKCGLFEPNQFSRTNQFMKTFFIYWVSSSSSLFSQGKKVYPWQQNGFAVRGKSKIIPGVNVIFSWIHWQFNFYWIQFDFTIVRCRMLTPFHLPVSWI